MEKEAQVIYKPHVAWASFWVSTAIWLSALTYFGLDYKKTEDQVELELKKIDLKIVEKTAELERIKSLANIKVVEGDEKDE